jgi:hypothetical protein
MACGAATPADAQDPHAHHLPAHAPPHAAEHAPHGLPGPYPMTRDASGTSWQPEAAPHEAAFVRIRIP